MIDNKNQFNENDYFTIYSLKKKKADNENVHCQLIKRKYPGQDSNLHAFDGASPSSWYVYQFHHLGILNAKL